MRQVFRGLSVVAAAVIASGCEVAGDAPAFPGTPVTGEELTIATALYAGAPRTPAGFSADDTPPGFAQVSTYHLKTRQLALSYELCTDDWNEAFAWSEEAAAEAPQALDHVANEVTERYFEFDRVQRTEPDRYVRMRVFRCSYLDRTGADTSASRGFAGVLNTRLLDAAALRDLSEYLWFFTAYNDADHVVLVRDWTHTAHASTGVLERAITASRDFFVRREDGTVVSC